MPQVVQVKSGVRVFFSYAHRDEKLRDELAKHLSILKRQGVITEWHDRRIIAGDEWEGIINQHLDRADIILLLISADFLASDYCYDVEVKRAMERHNAGTAQVIPVILRPVDWKGAPFGKLQALPKDAKAVILWKTWDEAFLNVAEGIKEVVKELDRFRKSIPKQGVVENKRRIWIVDKMRQGDFVTITEAINVAHPGDQIFVRPGVYREGLIIDKQLDIIGDGKVSEIIVQASGKNVISSRVAVSRLANLTLQQLGGGKWFCIDISWGFLDVLACDITSHSLACIAVHDGAEVSLRRNRVHHGNESGIVFFRNGRGRVEENEIFSNKCVGVKVTTGSNATMVYNKVYANSENGVLICNDAQGVLEANDIYGNGYAGVDIETGGDPIMRRNWIHNGKTNGILINENGLGTMEENHIFGNAYAGIEIRGGGSPIVRHNRINENGYQAIWIHDNGAGTFEDNDLRHNVHGAWKISEDSLPNVKRARNIEE